MKKGRAVKEGKVKEKEWRDVRKERKKGIK